MVIYGLPLAVLLQQQLLDKRLETHDYKQSSIVSEFWTHHWRPIQFKLVINYFGVKYNGKEHTKHLMSALKYNHNI